MAMASMAMFNYEDIYCLVVAPPPPLKNHERIVSCDDSFPKYDGKVMKIHGSKAPTR
jgi:hypothetical protein